MTWDPARIGSWKPHCLAVATAFAWLGGSLSWGEVSHGHHPSHPPHHHFGREAADGGPEFSLNGAWDSSYVLEGRDTLDHHSLWGYTLEAAWQNWLVGFWHAESPDVDYTELNLWLEYAFEVGAFEVYASYLHLWFVTDDAEDNEVGAGVAYTEFPGGIVPALDWYHSFEAHGSFLELSVSRELEVHEQLAVTPIALLGFNEGYLPEGHRGANYFALMLEAAVPLREQVELGGYVAYSWEIDSDPDAFAEDEFLRDFFYGGVSLTVSF